MLTFVCFILFVQFCFKIGLCRKTCLTSLARFYNIYYVEFIQITIGNLSKLNIVVFNKNSCVLFKFNFIEFKSCHVLFDLVSFSRNAMLVFLALDLILALLDLLVQLTQQIAMSCMFQQYQNAFMHIIIFVLQSVYCAFV